jgi:hypothetical protein
MSYEAAVKAIVAHFNDEWNNLTPVAYPDVAFTPPDETWVRLNVDHADGYQASMGSPGNNMFRREGLVNVQVFAKQGEAKLDALKKADAAISAFQGIELNGIHFYDVHMRDVGNDGAGWYQINVLANFRYDEIA